MENFFLKNFAFGNNFRFNDLSGKHQLYYANCEEFQLVGRWFALRNDTEVLFSAFVGDFNVVRQTQSLGRLLQASRCQG